MKNIIKILIFVAILMPVVAFAESSTPAPSPSVTHTVASVSSAPAASSASDSGAPASSNTSTSVAPASTVTTSSVTVNTAPSSTDTVVSTAPAATATSVSTSPVSTGTVTSVGSAPSSGNGSSGGSSSSRGSSSSGGSYVGGYMGCPLITTYMKFGANNNVTEVTKLQNFLKNVEKLDVDVNGKFDRKTENAVIAFQNKYSATTMGPWGHTQGTGYVYITTQKQINKIACNLPLTLNKDELAIINSSKSTKSNGQIIITPKNNVEVIKTEVNTISVSDESTSTSESISVESQTANVAKTSIMTRFWNFLIYLFK